MNPHSQHTMLFVFPFILQTLVWVPVRILLRFFVHFNIRGLENIRGLKKPVIFAVNHSSEWDPILVPAALPFFSPLSPMFYTSRERKFYDKAGVRSIFYGGKFFKAWGAYPVQVGVKDYERSLKTHIDILLNKRGSLCIFPEGEKTRDGNLLPAKGGTAYLSKRTGTPIVPVAISGIFGMKKKEFFQRKHHVVVSFGEPLHVDDLFEDKHYSPEEYKRFAQDVMVQIERLASTEGDNFLPVS